MKVNMKTKWSPIMFLILITCLIVNSSTVLVIPMEKKKKFLFSSKYDFQPLQPRYIEPFHNPSNSRQIILNPTNLFFYTEYSRPPQKWK